VTYRSHADLGGRAGQGRVVPESEGALFHAPWERKALALTLAMGATGVWNIDMSRRARETLPDYGSLSYYEIWIKALEKLLVEHALVEVDELSAGQRHGPARPVPRVLRATEVPAVLSAGAPTNRPPHTAARFVTGQRVRTRSGEVGHHTRLPGYVRGKVGRIDRVNGVHVFADTHARGLGEQPQWLYTVAFTARELWGEEAGEDLTVSIDAWEPYLEPVS
jgi:nitrile hydratase subunit beta